MRLWGKGEGVRAGGACKGRNVMKNKVPKYVCVGRARACLCALSSLHPLCLGCWPNPLTQWHLPGLWRIKVPPPRTTCRDTPTLSTASPSAPTGDSWLLAAMTRRRGCGTCPLASNPQCLRSVRGGGGRAPPHYVNRYIGGNLWGKERSSSHGAKGVRCKVWVWAEATSVCESDVRGIISGGRECQWGEGGGYSI